MPTLDDKIKEKEEQLKVYQDALADVIAQLTKKRTEMAAESKKTLADYEYRIPELNDKIKRQQKLIDSLDDQIEAKQDKMSKQKQSYQEEYDKLTEKLKLDYEQKEIKLSVKETKFKDEMQVARNKIKEDKSAVDAARSGVEAIKVKLSNDDAILNKFKLDLMEDRKKFTELKEIELKSINDEKALIATWKEEARQKKDNVSKKLVELKEREVLAKDTIAKIDDVEKKVKDLEQREDTLLYSREVLNKDKVSVIVETKRLNKLRADLNSKSLELDKREKNIKEAEANIGG